MNVIVTIEGREAIPVRAIPYLTDWEVMSPDVVADALTGEDEFNPQFKELRAYRFDDDTIKVVNPNWWANFTARELKALSDRIRDSEISHETGHDDWRRDSPRKLPAGVFVWRDEFEACFWSRFGPEGETVLALTPEGELKRQRRSESIELDYDPLIPAKNICELVMEGFVAQSEQSHTQAVPIATVSASGGEATVNAGQRKSGSNMRDLVLPYMRRVYKAGQYSTAKEFFRALEKKAGIDDSPFEQGKGLQVGSLFVRKLGKPLSLKAVQNHYWKELRDSR